MVSADDGTGCRRHRGRAGVVRFDAVIMDVMIPGVERGSPIGADAEDKAGASNHFIPDSAIEGQMERLS
jgi:hypothetical protein